jgi:signal transduction histidine kinase
MKIQILIHSVNNYLQKHVYAGLFFLFLFICQNATTQNITVYDSIGINFPSSGKHPTINFNNLSLLQFKEPGNRRANFGLTGNECYYLLLKINATCPNINRYLYVDNTSLDTLNIYRIVPDKEPTLLYQGGSLVHYEPNRLFTWHTLPIHLNLTPSYYLISTKAAQKNINFKYEIADQDELLNKYQNYQKVIFFYTGIAFTISAIVFLAFVLFKKAALGAYLGYLVFLSGWILSHYGILFPSLYPNLPVLNEIIKPISSLGATYFLLTVIQLIFNNFIKRTKVLQKFVTYTRYALLVTTALVCCLLYPGSNPIIKAILVSLWHIDILISLCFIIFIPFLFIRTGNIAKIFSFSMIIVCIMVVVQWLGNSGYINNFYINEHGTAFATLLENSIMAVGLFYGLMEERRNKDAQLRFLEREQMKTLKKLITVQDNERKRIAGDLHDTIGPLLAALKINFRRLFSTLQSTLKPDLVQSTETIIDDSISEIRAISHNLMPKNLSSKGLINTLSDYFKDLQLLYNKPITFEHSIQSIVEPELEINIYRIICELTLNGAKHSNATLIKVSIHTESNSIYICVNDNGQGFQINGSIHKNALGLQNAESRVQYLNGEFNLTSEIGKGTAVNIKIPL